MIDNKGMSTANPDNSMISMAYNMMGVDKLEGEWTSGLSTVFGNYSNEWTEWTMSGQNWCVELVNEISRLIGEWTEWTMSGQIRCTLNQLSGQSGQMPIRHVLLYTGQNGQDFDLKTSPEKWTVIGENEK